jgi:class 3 adenylate cyclase/DNA-binding beta-propeller fold protein YncE
MPRRTQTKQRLLTTVLFTDIVGSTQHASELGDRRWRQLLGRHHNIVRRLLKRHGGREIDTAGDGFFATFDQPAQAIECAVAIGRAVRPLGIEVRAGVHMGEVEITVDKVAGIAVHIGSRVMSTAVAGEVLVSNTVRDLLSGSEFRFEDRGLQQLKGIPGEWRLSAVTEVPRLEEEEFPEGEAAPTRRRRISVPLAALIVLGVVAVLVIPPLIAGGGGKGGGLPPPAVNTVVRIDPSANKVLGGIAVGGTPIAIAAEKGGSVWVGNFDDGTVQSIDPSRNEPSSPKALGFDQAPTGLSVGGGFVWITSSNTGFLYRLDPTQSHAIVPIHLGVGVSGVAYGQGVVWVTNGQSETVLRIDPQNPQSEPTTMSLETGSKPTGIAVGAGSVWVAESLKGKVVRIDPDTLKVTATVPILSGSPDQVTWGEGFIWVTDTDHDTVVRISPDGNSPTTIPGVGNGPTGIAAGLGYAWVANSLDGTVAKIDPRTATVTDRYRLGAGLSPDGVAVSDGAVWVTVHSP